MMDFVILLCIVWGGLHGLWEFHCSSGVNHGEDAFSGHHYQRSMIGEIFGSSHPWGH